MTVSRQTSRELSTAEVESSLVPPKRASKKAPRPSWNLSLPFPPPEARRALISWYHRNDRQLPWRRLWAETRDPYVVWVSEIMLQQTLIKAVIPVFERFILRFPTVSHLARASEDDVRSAVRGLGYYRRFGMLHAAAKVILDDQGIWPTSFDGWKALPGVGDYTAAAVSSIAFEAPHAVVDGNVERVLCRLLDLQVSPDEPGLKSEFKTLAQTFLDPRRPGDFNQALMELGQLCCTVASPSCHVCPIAKQCLSNARNTQDLCPKPKTRRTAIKVDMRLGIICRGNKVALVERPVAATFLRASWGFLTGIAARENQYHWDGGPASSSINKALTSAKPLAKKVKHSITHHQIQAQVVSLDHSVLPETTAIRWVPMTKVEEALVSNLDRKAWKIFRTRA